MLIELIVAIVILSIAITGVILGSSRITRGSADPMIYTQAQAIAEAYLEEILAQGFSCGGGPEGGETRATYDDVDDYHAPAYAAVSDQEGNLVAELAAFRVSVTVECAALNGIGSTDAARIRVRVRNPGFSAGDAAALTGYRTRI
jgi:MSHA pilin protein MshD